MEGLEGRAGSVTDGLAGMEGNAGEGEGALSIATVT